MILIIILYVFWAWWAYMRTSALFIHLHWLSIIITSMIAFTVNVEYIPLNSAAYLSVTLVEQSMSSFLSARLTGQYCPKSPTRCRNSSGVMHMSAMDAAWPRKTRQQRRSLRSDNSLFLFYVVINYLKNIIMLILIKKLAYKTYKIVPVLMEKILF